MTENTPETPTPPAPGLPGPVPPGGGLTRNLLIGVVVVSLSVAGATAVYLLVKHRGDVSEKTTGGQMQTLTQEYTELKKKYEDLEVDRNNVLAQTKTLLQEKSQWTETQAQVENLKKTNRLYLTQKDKILSDNQKLKADMASILESFETLKESYKELQAKEEQAEKENANLRDLLTKQVQATPEYQVLDRESKRLRDENLRLGETINLLEERIKKALDRIKKDQIRELSLVRQVREQKTSLDELRAHNTALGKGNQDLNDLISQAPDKIKEMAAQNSVLLKETAEMHYNMAVFFTDNKEFTRAEAEYKRALDFDPNNLKVHYNLGYLYAEELHQPEKAASHLEKFLQIDPSSKDSESVRSYLSTLSVWNTSLKPKKR